MECNTTHIEITVTGKPKPSYLLIKRAINISTVDWGIERKVLPVFSFKVFEVRVAGCAVPKIPNKQQKKDFAVWYLRSLKQHSPPLKESKATAKTPNACYQPDRCPSQNSNHSWDLETKEHKENNLLCFLVYFHFCLLHFSQLRIIPLSTCCYLAKKDAFETGNDTEANSTKTTIKRESETPNSQTHLLVDWSSTLSLPTKYLFAMSTPPYYVPALFAMSIPAYCVPASLCTTKRTLWHIGNAYVPSRRLHT